MNGRIDIISSVCVRIFIENVSSHAHKHVCIFTWKYFLQLLLVFQIKSNLSCSSHPSFQILEHIYIKILSSLFFCFFFSILRGKKVYVNTYSSQPLVVTKTGMDNERNSPVFLSCESLLHSAAMDMRLRNP